MTRTCSLVLGSNLLILAGCGGNVSTAPLTPVASVVVTPAAPSLLLGGTVQLTAMTKDAAGNALTGRVVTWASSDTNAATVSASGLVTGRAAGSATITAASEGKNGTALITVTTLRFASVSAGVTHGCGVVTGGSAYCWGRNQFGELGNGDTTSSTTPVAVVGGRAFAGVSADGETCGVTTGNAAYCWGNNMYGSLGNGTTTSSTTPVPVSSGLSFSFVSQGNASPCALTTGGTAYCWGYNSSGQLGNGTTTNSTTPVAVSGGLAFAVLSAGSSNHTCSATTTGTAYCWGDNQYGELGNGTTTNSSTPVVVSGSLTFASVSAGALHTCGLTMAGAAYCWGFNSGGQLGDGTTADRATPVAVGGALTFGVVSAGLHLHSCGITTSGVAYCWGDNGWGELGSSTPGYSTTPVVVTGNLRFAAISAGADFTCGLTTGGVAYCWGHNDVGQLGDGSTTDSNVPVKVVGQP